MRIGIYAYGPCTITLDAAVTLTRFSRDGAHPEFELGPGTVSLAAGIYRIVSAEHITVVGSLSCDLFVSLNDSAPWPDPAVTFGRFRSTFPEVSYAALRPFFEMTSIAVAKSPRMTKVAICAYAPATVAVDQPVVVTRYPGSSPSDDFKAGPGKMQLAPGIYRIYLDAPLAVTCDVNSDVVTITGKEIPQVSSNLGRFAPAFPTVTAPDLERFFPLVERGLDLSFGAPTKAHTAVNSR